MRKLILTEEEQKGMEHYFYAIDCAITAFRLAAVLNNHAEKSLWDALYKIHPEITEEEKKLLNMNLKEKAFYVF